jgi:hypothetical protein
LLVYRLLKIHFTNYTHLLDEPKIIDKTNIASVLIDKYVFFANVIMESIGRQKIVAQGFSKADAREIVNLLT